MIYEYECENCGRKEDVYKSFQDYDRIEKCEECTSPMKRLISPGFFMGEKVESAYFHPALGCVVSGDTQAAKIAKSRGMECVGNEIPSKHLKGPKPLDYMDEKSWQV